MIYHSTLPIVICSKRFCVKNKTLKKPKNPNTQFLPFSMFGAKIAFTYKVHIYGHTGVDLGGVGVRTTPPLPSPSGIRTPRHPKVPPLVLFYAIHFRPTNLKPFLKAPSEPIYSKLKDSARRKKTQFFWPKISKKCPQHLFYLFRFSKKLPAAKVYAQLGPLYSSGSARKTNMIEVKKIDKYFKHFLKRVCETV